MNIPGWEDSEGRVAGLEYRETKPGEVCPLFSEKIKVIPTREWSDILEDPNRITLRSSVPVILDQDSVGSCAAESATQCVMTSRSFHGQSFVSLNPWGLYAYSSGGRDGGSNLDTNCEYLRDKGVPPLDLWPRSKGWRPKPTGEAAAEARKYRIVEFYDIQTAEEFGTALILGFPVSYGRRGHSIMGTDLVNDREFRMCNSWGNWGDQGFAVESFRGINWGYGAWAIRVATDTRDTSTASVSELPPMFEPYPKIST
jgi:hypothetical protein